MLHELLIVPATITPVRSHIAGERDRRQDRERRAKTLDDARPNPGEMRGGRCVETKTNERWDRPATCRFRSSRENSARRISNVVLRRNRRSVGYYRETLAERSFASFLDFRSLRFYVSPESPPILSIAGR